MNKIPHTLATCFLLAGAAQAATVTFLDLSNANGTANNLNVGGSAGDLAVVRTIDSSSGFDQYVFNVTYTGMDFDGVGGNDTLTYSVRVAAMSGNTVTSSLTTLETGGTSGAVALDGNAANAGTAPSASFEGFGINDQMANGQTLIFTVENIAVDVAGYTGTFNGFNSVVAQSDGPGDALAIVGVGTGLEEYYTATNHQFTGLSDTTLVISSANPTGGADNDWGARYLDYSITVVPEPSSAMLLGLGAAGLMGFRRRTHK